MTAAIGVIAGIQAVPAAKPNKGTLPGTSLASIAARSIFGKQSLPFGMNLPAPTQSKPTARSTRVGTVVGRLAPGALGVVGMGMFARGLFAEDRRVMECTASCQGLGR